MIQLSRFDQEQKKTVKTQ